MGRRWNVLLLMLRVASLLLLLSMVVWLSVDELILKGMSRRIRTLHLLSLRWCHIWYRIGIWRQDTVIVIVVVI